ncbi:RIP metalloprotease RseP [Chryseobacterium shandongense]|uniref:Zinc metalloprotease n=1 Tax=Chryseobacterium shandongense TaxID=1493872 RepID=A0A3G6MU86_9FLAO|nr:RIP metalloprotease RseP [Chryseobacterium shandongense]AZA59214.1 RIP metalloprotease RseP [Chryseobacterium shandongense]AZA87358.1 RIP metalloprotease RseP [Chryseobacterium shandongense]AZA95859.1 RIP metalloprotease RseP [Chryseobacterium shandongense]
MEIAIKLFQFILSISILVLLHELGHFLPAKWFKTRAEKFFLFFDPWFSIFSMKKINGKWEYKFLSKNLPDTEIIEVNGEKKEIPVDLSKLPDNDWRKHPEQTKYGIGWLPFGGYVKIAGMVDESMDIEQLKKPAQPWEFRSKPAWQRLIIMLGGVTVNFFLAWIIYTCLSLFNGETYTDLSKFESGVGVTEAGKKMGFQNGDKIVSIDGKPADRLENASINILLGDHVTVLRNGKETTFPINKDGVADVLKQKEARLYITPRFPMIVDSLATPSSKASGLTKGDKVIAINGQPTQYFDEVGTVLNQNKGKTVNIDVLRNGKPETVSAAVDKNGKLGIAVDQKSLLNVVTNKKYSFGEAIPRGFVRTIEALTMQVKQFKIMFNSKIQGYKNVGGPIAIVKNMPVDKDANGNFSVNWAAFWGFTAMFSVWLAFLNLIPIPGLDGGHVLFTLYEIIVGKPVPQKVLENAQMIGVIFLLGLMILIFGSDIFKIFAGKL